VLGDSGELGGQEPLLIVEGIPSVSETKGGHVKETIQNGDIESGSA
jgi:hypothetical protein